MFYLVKNFISSIFYQVNQNLKSCQQIADEGLGARGLCPLEQIFDL